MFRNKEAKPDMLRKVRVGSPYFMIYFFFSQGGGSFPKMWEVSESVDRSVRCRVRALHSAAFHNGLVPRLIASICFFSVVCQGAIVCIGVVRERQKKGLHLNIWTDGQTFM